MTAQLFYDELGTSSDAGTDQAARRALCKQRAGFRVMRLLKKVWIPVVLVVALAVSGVLVMRLHKVFGSEDLNAAGVSVKIVQFNPKIMLYDVFGPAGSSAKIVYLDADANTHEVNVALPWSETISTTLPSVSGNIMAQGDGDQIGCRITVDGTVRNENSTDGVNAQTFCLVKSA